uniref:Uncharacterized protein n=1 Tax=Arundo donax TaxID=35708 RepID=A0A0A8ZW92_ARUDO
MLHVEHCLNIYLPGLTKCHDSNSCTRLLFGCTASLESHTPQKDHRPQDSWYGMDQ